MAKALMSGDIALTEDRKRRVEVIEYVAALCRMRNGNPEPYESTRFLAASDVEAKQKARDWARSFDFVADDELLQINVGGRGICTIHRKDF
jgi:hypothetical protein